MQLLTAQAAYAQDAHLFQEKLLEVWLKLKAMAAHLPQACRV